MPPLAWTGLAVAALALGGITFALLNPSASPTGAPSPNPSAKSVAATPPAATPAPTPTPDRATATKQLVGLLDRVAASEAMTQAQEDGIRQAIAQGADINARSQGGATALHLAVFLGRADLTAFLLQRNPQLETKNQYGYTALHIAAQKDRAALVKAGARPDAKDNQGKTPMDFARGLGYTDVVSALH